MLYLSVFKQFRTQNRDALLPELLWSGLGATGPVKPSGRAVK
jgi:hypothetical protein